MQLMGGGDGWESYEKWEHSMGSHHKTATRCFNSGAHP
jgi:hypothetical protein